MDSEALPPEAPKSSEGELIPVFIEPDRKFPPMNRGTPTRRVRPAKAAAVSKLIRNEFVVRLFRHMEMDRWKAFEKGMKSLMAKFEEGDEWAMEFVRDTMDGKPGIRMNMDAPDPSKSITITIQADDANLL